MAPTAGLDRWVPTALVLMLMALEAYAGGRRRKDAATRDRGSLLAVYVLVGGGFYAGFTLWARGAPPPRLGPWALAAGAALATAGTALRLWAVVTLGRYFTYAVQVSSDQKVVETGPYRLIRHPAYTGGLMLALGIALSLRYAWAPLIVGLPNLAAYLIRIVVEERALSEGIGEPYRAYMARTKRLIPYVW
jgi:protein-S-isoprenylcysteine O-methyltransferase Ste14